MQLELFTKKSEVKTNYPELLAVGPWGIQWKGGERIFGFSCAGCGGSGINQEPVNHTDNCDSGSPYKERN